MKNIKIANIEKHASLPDSVIAHRISGGIEKDDTETIEYALAYCRKKSLEALGYSPFDEQLHAAFALYNENIIEMRTGEGKTLSAAIAAYLVYLSKRKLHILTFNDYLAKRDCAWMKPLYTALGMTVSFINERHTADNRRTAYEADVVYSTAKECGFDFLRDSIAFSKAELVSRHRDFVIVDEADSVMLDEARVPLIIAGKRAANEVIVDEVREILNLMETFESTDYGIERKTFSAYMHESAISKCESHYNIDNLYESEHSELMYKLNDCLKALFYYEKDKDYIVAGGEVKIIDEFTGRVNEKQRYPGLVHIALELKHGLPVKNMGVILGEITLHMYLKRYSHLAGMTGTAAVAAYEFGKLYQKNVLTIPPHSKSRRIDRPFSVWYTKEIKYKEIVREVTREHKRGRPILIGTGDIEESEYVAELLRQNGVTPAVLNAKNDEQEAVVIRNAGATGAVTVSTNMAGRGIDIKLGGEDSREYDKVSELGGLLVVQTFMRDNRRQSEQLFGRAGRQGDKGETVLYVSAEDDVLVNNKWQQYLLPFQKPSYTEKQLDSKAILRAAEKALLLNEVKLSDERQRLESFMKKPDKHFLAVNKKRMSLLKHKEFTSVWERLFAADYAKITSKQGEKAVRKAERQALLAATTWFWSEYLSYVTYIKLGAHLSVIAKKDPTVEYNIKCVAFFDTIDEQIDDFMTTEFEKFKTFADGENKPSAYEPEKPREFYTFLLNDVTQTVTKRSRFSAIKSDEVELI